ncbi:hypothetical protein GGI35DRAFT_409448 [Trichoderma velutinum]
MMNEEKSRTEAHGRADYVLFMLTKLRHWCHSNLCTSQGGTYVTLPDSAASDASPAVLTTRGTRARSGARMLREIVMDMDMACRQGGCHGRWEVGGGLRRGHGSDDTLAAIRLPPAFSASKNTHHHHVNRGAAPLVFQSGGPGRAVIGSRRFASRRPQHIWDPKPGDNSSVEPGWHLRHAALIVAPFLPVGANGRDLSPHAWMGSSLTVFFFSGCSALVRFFRAGGLRGKGDKSPRANLRQP